MSTQASDWYLYADTDLYDPENTVQLFKYRQAVKGEHIDHYLNHKELIPQFSLVERLLREFPKYTEEQLDELFCAGYDILYADEINEEYMVQDSEELRALTEDLFEYIKLRIKQDRHEKAVLKKLEEDI
jgi:hypothetical protein